MQRVLTIVVSLFLILCLSLPSITAVPQYCNPSLANSGSCQSPTTSSGSGGGGGTGNVSGTGQANALPYWSSDNILSYLPQSYYDSGTGFLIFTGTSVQPFSLRINTDQDDSALSVVVGKAGAVGEEIQMSDAGDSEALGIYDLNTQLVHKFSPDGNAYHLGIDNASTLIARDNLYAPYMSSNRVPRTNSLKKFVDSSIQIDSASGNVGINTAGTGDADLTTLTRIDTTTFHITGGTTGVCIASAGDIGISQNITLNQTNVNISCINGDCRTAWPSGGSVGNTNLAYRNNSQAWMGQVNLFNNSNAKLSMNGTLNISADSILFYDSTGFLQHAFFANGTTFINRGGFSVGTSLNLGSNASSNTGYLKLAQGVASVSPTVPITDVVTTGTKAITGSANQITVTNGLNQTVGSVDVTLSIPSTSILQSNNLGIRAGPTTFNAFFAITGNNASAWYRWIQNNSGQNRNFLTGEEGYNGTARRIALNRSGNAETLLYALSETDLTPKGIPTVTSNGTLTSSTVLTVSNATNNGMDRCTFVSGTCTIANTRVTANTNIFCFEQSQGGTIGSIGINTRNAGANYTVSSSNALDTSVVACMLVEPAG